MTNTEIINGLGETMPDRKKYLYVMKKIEHAMTLITEAVADTMELCGDLPDDEKSNDQREALHEAISYLDYANEEADKAYDSIFQIY